MFWIHLSLNCSKLADTDAIVSKFKSDISNNIYKHFRAVCAYAELSRVILVLFKFCRSTFGEIKFSL